MQNLIDLLGGAGGHARSFLDLSAGTTYTITVGAGGGSGSQFAQNSAKVNQHGGNSSFAGSGISTFRIRESNYGSKTETHNDIALVLYETGIFGLLFLLISICIISIKSFNLYKKTNELHFLAAFSSLIGLVLLVNFSNFINTFMFAIIVGLSLAIQNFKKTDE